jgi:hypothetical protein
MLAVHILGPRKVAGKKPELFYDLFSEKERKKVFHDTYKKVF